jgi:CelD/BcsL family acetyltransferase involved in cellulose biosynthesis
MTDKALSMPTYSVTADRAAGLTVTVARTVAEAARHGVAWQALADRAADANAFYEPWCLLPALEQYGAGRDTRIVFVQSGQDGRLLGVFPMEARARFHGLPVPHLVAWRHPHAFLAQPLVDQTHAVQVWQRFLAWAGRDGAWFVDLPEMIGDGPTAAALQAAAGGRCRVIDSFDRALLLRDAPTAQDYIDGASSSGSRKDWRRLMRRLSEQGTLEVRSLQASDDVAPWISDFLMMEAAGWKGRNGTALATDAAGTAFFHNMATAAHARGALHMAGLFMDGRAVALQCNLFAQGQGAAFKVAFDENWAAFSPGVLLEVEAIRDVYARPGFVAMDSCTGRDHPLMNRLWRGVRRIDRCRVATRMGGRAVLALQRLRGAGT